MRNQKATFIRVALASAVGLGVLFVGGLPSISSGGLVSTASARVGRPATPVSYAGVARRTTRRAVGAAAASSAQRCVQVADAYGRIVTRCY